MGVVSQFFKIQCFIHNNNIIQVVMLLIISPHFFLIARANKPTRWKEGNWAKAPSNERQMYDSLGLTLADKQMGQGAC